MAFENPPISELRVPDTAGVGGDGIVRPGLVVTTDVPTELTTFYGVTPAAAQLYYGNNPDLYWYDLVFGNIRIHGYVYQTTTVRELYREPFDIGDPSAPAVFTVPGQTLHQSGVEFQSWRKERHVGQVSRPAAFATTNGVIPFTIEDHDPSAMMTASATPFTVPTTGLWCVTAQTTCDSGPVGGYRSVAIKTNGAFAGDEFKVPGVPIANAQSLQVVVERLWNAGDDIAVNVFSSVAGSTWSDSRLTVKLVSVT